MTTVASESVIVVGGGPAGASTAWSLARAGVDVLIVDRAHFPRDKPCAEYLSPEASRILSDMGALEACDAAGAAHLAGMIVRAPGGVLIHGEFAAAHGFTAFRDRGLALRRSILDQILLDRARAAGARVVEGERVIDLIRDDEGVVRGVRTLDESTVTRARAARLVVGADGLRSIVARKLGLAHASRYPRRVAFVAHFKGVTGVGEHGEMHVERGGYVGIADVGGDLTNVAIVVPAPAAREAAGRAAEFMDAWVARRPQLAPRFAHATRVGPVRATGPFASHARRAVARGAALVGDAADFFDPFTGEGIYAALRGGELLAPTLISSLAQRSDAAAFDALSAYEAQRRAVFSGKWKVEQLIGRAVSFPWLIDRIAVALARRQDMADLLIGVTGDFVPPSEVLRTRYVLRLLLGTIFNGRVDDAAVNPTVLAKSDASR